MTWLVLVGSVTWMRSRESVLPPLWDQQSYVQKAEAIWTSISKGTGENPLSIEPSVRPPGTVLLTAPLGPLSDVRNFYFRSVFLPVVIMAFSVFITGVKLTGLGWESAFVALLAASMPMFWHLEIGPDYYWGLMDTFLASLGALGMASLLVAALRFEWVWIGPALVSLALLPLVKPTGFLVGGFISLAWLSVAVPFASLHPRGQVRGWIGIAATGLAITGVLGGVALGSFSSDYFSYQNIEYGKVALAQLRGESFGNNSSYNIVKLLLVPIGTPLLIAVAVLAARALVQRKKRVGAVFPGQARWMSGIGILVLVAGVVMSYQTTLLRQHRYFFPALSVAIVLFVPTLVVWSKRAGKLICTGLAIIPMALLVFLSSPKFTDLAFSIGGYSLVTGFGRGEVRTANAFIDQFRVRNEEPPVLFTTNDGFGTAAFQGAFDRRFREVGFSTTQAAQSIKGPFSWDTGGLVTINSIYNADILAIERQSSFYDSTQPLTFGEELKAWKAWLAATPTSGSTEVVLKTPTTLALAVRDRTALEHQMREFIASRPWRPDFLAANGRSEFGQEEVSKLNLGALLISKPVDFGDAVRLHALSMSKMSGERKINVDVFSEHLGKNASRRSFFFIHQLDSNGKIISNHEVELPSSRFADRPVSRSRYSFIRLPNTAQLGVGVYESGGSSLVTDWTLAKDWGGRRAKIGILSLPVSIDSEDSP